MIIDFHTHGKLAKKMPFSSEYTNWLFQEASQSGLDAICLTEHFNTLGFNEIYQYISDNYPRDGDSFLFGSLRIFPGMEIDIAEGGHILVIGSVEDMIDLNYNLDDYKEKNHFLSFENLLLLLKKYTVLLGAAHPFREGGHIPGLPFEQLRHFDFIDLNGKDIATNRLVTEKLTYRMAKQLELPILAGSDTHQSFQYGCIKNIFSKDCNTINALKSEIHEGKYQLEIAETAAFQVRSAGLLKRSLKEIQTLGGDYVAVLLNKE